MGATTYTVFITPLITEDVYGAEVEISELVLQAGIGKIKEAIDSTDYDFGLFTFGDIQIKCQNRNGKLNDETDERSMFPFTRDRAKVRIVFRKTTDTDALGTVEADTVTFNGTINEEATRLSIKNETINFKILSRDSVIRNTNISGGTVSTGQLISTSLKTILNTTRITSVLNFDASKINPDLDFAIESGSFFDSISTIEGVKSLLIGSNSVFLIDSTNTMVVKSRRQDEFQTAVNLFGPHDLLGRENIISIVDYNTGKHRMFNSVKVNGFGEGDTPLQIEFGFRNKDIDLAWITTELTARTVAKRLLKEFKAPKIELRVRVSTEFAKTLEILDRFSLDYPLRIGKPENDKFLPIIGVAKIGDVDVPLPRQFGAISISPAIAFKAISTSHLPKSFISELKLRQVGTELNDGVFNVPNNCIVGFAIIGEAVICAGDTDPFNPSVIGAAKIGSTKVI